MTRTVVATFTTPMDKTAIAVLSGVSGGRPIYDVHLLDDDGVAGPSIASITGCFELSKYASTRCWTRKGEGRS
jgi:hypothetical protein